MAQAPVPRPTPHEQNQSVASIVDAPGLAHQQRALQRRRAVHSEVEGHRVREVRREERHLRILRAERRATELEGACGDEAVRNGSHSHLLHMPPVLAVAAGDAGVKQVGAATHHHVHIRHRDTEGAAAQRGAACDGHHLGLGHDPPHNPAHLRREALHFSLALGRRHERRDEFLDLGIPTAGPEGRRRRRHHARSEHRRRLGLQRPEARSVCGNAL
mmetsp:Transcript_66497/g.191950  ORF Transcript_66497/g.191950 Transcript_66497/m.191950 type:complete len:216 (+) Transcript_66497:16-663(+)